jgi:hypothetical protein
MLVGLGAAFLAPAEVYSFYLFAEGGRFHYEGFGFGSLVFGLIAGQIIGYYLLAAIFIPLGYGHLRRRRWARKLALAVLWFWVIVGVPLLFVFMVFLLGFKEMSVALVLLALIGLGLAYLVVPGLLIWFYRSRDVRLSFERHDPRSYRIERIPVPVLVLGMLLLFYTVLLHIPLFFNGIFPLFGQWVLGLPGILLLTVSILLLAGLAWGTFRQEGWAWWGALIFLVLMGISAIWTLAQSSLDDILTGMRFPPTEMEILQGLPLRGLHFAPLIGIPLLLSVGWLILSRRHFEDRGPEGAAGL